MAFNYFYIADFTLALVGFSIVRTFLRSKHQPPLPPGPKGLPLIGNVLDMPSGQEWTTFAKWGEAYGDISSVTVLGQPLIIINSADAAIEMLDKKSSIYSDRPVLQMAGELVGWKNTLVLLPYGERFRRFRRFFHKSIGSRNIMKQYMPAEEHETLRFLRRVLTKPEDLPAHIRRATASVVLRISHGYEVKENNDPVVELADKATEQFSLSSAPGGFLVDVIPALRHVPAWFPGAAFKSTAVAWASTLAELVETPHEFVKQQMAAGTASVSFSSILLESKQLEPEEEFDLKWSSASLYTGAVDTTVAALHAFFLAMSLHPEVAKKAQTEIDFVTGKDRLPSFADRDQLPFVNALVKELFRWHSVTPTGVPHRVMQDDVHKGFFIPKGSLVIPNLWKITHDPITYPNPNTFDPDRFIPSEGKGVQRDPGELCFGFGRRSCPGSHFADATVFITCAMALAVFDITKHVENGCVVEPIHGNTTGTISHPTPFRCTIKPRSEKSVLLIQGDDAKACL